MGGGGGGGPSGPGFHGNYFGFGSAGHDGFHFRSADEVFRYFPLLS